MNAATVTSVTTSAEPRVRLDSLTGLRWWAAFGVFIYHMLNFAPVPVLSEFAPFGNSGVAFFFVLSGFVLTYSARVGTTVRNFYWRRFARIYPAHFVALLLAIPVFYSVLPGPQQDWVKPFSIGVLLLSVFLVQGWSRDPAIIFSGNPAAWTLTVEAFFYALHPWVNRLLRPLQVRGAWLWILAAVAFSFFYRVAFVLDQGGPLSWVPVPVSRLSEFVIGMGLAQLLLRGFRIPLPPFVGYTILTAFVCWQVATQRWTFDDPFSVWAWNLHEQILVVIFALIILSTAMRDALQGPSLLRSTLMVRLGAWSFAFYLVHATVIYAFMALFGRHAIGYSNLLWYIPTFGLALLLAWALYRFIEHPLEASMRRWGDKRLA